MVTEKYSGTKGLNIETAINRIYEIMDKQPLSPKDEEFYNESKELIINELKVLLKDSKGWQSVKDNLTQKQWQKIWSEL